MSALVKIKVNHETTAQGRRTEGGWFGSRGQFCTVHLNNWLGFKPFALSFACFSIAVSMGCRCLFLEAPAYL